MISGANVFSDNHLFSLHWFLRLSGTVSERIGQSLVSLTYLLLTKLTEACFANSVISMFKLLV